jgi:aminoglycoside phosphotransferase (APT) family kinase protein
VSHVAENPDFDRAGHVRKGEELEVTAVDTWLRTQLPELSPGLPAVTQYSGGASNWTYRLQYTDRDLILRRPPAGTKSKSAHDMSREFTVQKALKPAYPLVPTMVALCTNPSVMGVDFYVMERIPGLIPRANMPRRVTIDPRRRRQLCFNVFEQLIKLHKLDYRALGLETLGKGGGYTNRQIDGWCDRYEKARTWNVPTFSYVRRWLRDNTPPDVMTCIIHNDWRLDNIVLDSQEPTRVIGVLDWEMATLGDPLMDLGNSLAYWVQADDPFLLRSTRRQPSHLAGMLKRDEIVAYYLDRMGFAVDNWTFYEVYGLFRLAVIVQQIYYRYFHKQTRNPAFKNFWILVIYIDWRCIRLIKKSKR